MEKKRITHEDEKKRKILLVLALSVLLVLSLLVWVLARDKDNVASTGADEKRGFNIALPNPNFKEDLTLNKMSYYDRATTDSLKRQEEFRKDPNYSDSAALEDGVSHTEELESDPPVFRKGKTALSTRAYRDSNQEKVYQKLKALQKVLAEPPKSIGQDQDLREFDYSNSSSSVSTEIKDLEQMMSALNTPAEPDAELKQLGGMLENILDIQHPQRVQEKIRQASKEQKGKVFGVSKESREEVISSLQPTDPNASTTETNGFYSLEGDLVSDEVQNAIEAVVHQTQTIVNGSIIKLRLTNDVFINGVLMPKNSFVFGIAALKGERLEVKIDNLQFNNTIFPVALSVYDIDGIGGIYIPGAISREVAKASADRSMQGVGISSLDDSWGAQAAGMGVEAAKSLLSKKVKLIKVVVKAGYQVLLYDEKEKNTK